MDSSQVKKYKKYVGKMIKVAFLDHAIGTKRPVLCTAMGQVTEITDDSLVIRYWHCVGIDEEHNNEYMVILHSTIKKIQSLK